MDTPGDAMPGPSGSGSWRPATDQAFLLRYFQENKNARGLLPKEMVSPFALKALLPSLLLLEHRSAGDWRFTLVGTAVVNGYGKDFTGERLSDIDYSPCRGVYEKMIEIASTSRRSAVCFGTLHYPGRNFLKSVKTIYPVTTNGTDVTNCLLLLSIVEKTHDVELLYTPLEPTRGEDGLFLINDETTDGSWSIEQHAEILYAAE